MKLMVIGVAAVLQFGVLSGESTVVDPNQRLKRIDVTTKDRTSKRTDPRTIRRPISVSTKKPVIVFTVDPNGDALKCTRYDDGRFTECVQVTFTDDVERELREQVRIATRSIGIPGLLVQTRPQPEALINIDTMLYAKADTFERTVNLLGRDVTIRAVPSRFVWHHGDGTTQTTRSPGKPNANSEVSHVYRKPAEGLGLSVDTTWAIQYRVGGGTWQELDETLTISGPVTRLTTREARPYLVAR